MATLLALVHTGPDNGEFLDVGAHFGLYAGVLERLSGERLRAVHAFEPTPTTYETGCRLREANCLHFGYHRLALSNDTGEASLFLSNTSEVTNSLVAGFRRARGTLSVETMRMDDLVAELGVAPSLLKIDVECHEVPVLEGALDTIERHRPSLVMEVLERHHEAFLATAVWQRLRELGYIFYHITPAVPWRAMRRNELYPRSRDLLLVTKALDGTFWQEYMPWRYAISQCTHRLHRRQ
jgi:FkbM family methyltransferase